jgi:hypothetical protein
MNELIRKYNLLDDAARQELNNFLESLLAKMQRQNNDKQKSYKERIKKVSVWTNEDSTDDLAEQAVNRSWDKSTSPWDSI